MANRLAGRIAAQWREDSKLTDDLVREARRRYAQGESQHQIAKDLHQVTAEKAITGKTRKHVK